MLLPINREFFFLLVLPVISKKGSHCGFASTLAENHVFQSAFMQKGETWGFACLWDLFVFSLSLPLHLASKHNKSELIFFPSDPVK